MKKFLSFATLTVTIFLLVACGSSSKSENSASSDKVELSSTDSTTTAIFLKIQNELPASPQPTQAICCN